MLKRICTKCNQSFLATLKFFPPHKGCLYGLGPECRSCHNARIRKWKRRHRKRLAIVRRQQYKNRYGDRQRQLEQQRATTFPIRVQAERLSGGIRERSKELGFVRPAQLANKQFFIAWLTRQPTCPVCGVKFSLISNGCGPRNDGPSIDRFDTTRGYDLDNIALICWRCNNIKRNYSSADLRCVADWIDAWGNETDKFEAVVIADEQKPEPA